MYKIIDWLIWSKNKILSTQFMLSFLSKKIYNIVIVYGFDHVVYIDL